MLACFDLQENVGDSCFLLQYLRIPNITDNIYLVVHRTPCQMVAVLQHDVVCQTAYTFQEKKK